MKPILFNTEMVKAILDGRKTQTRRIIPNEWIHSDKAPIPTHGEDGCVWHFWNFGEKQSKYKTDDVLYVRETFQLGDNIRNIQNVPLNEDIEVLYYEHEINNHNSNHRDFAKIIKWTSSIHMPKKYARIFLKVINVRVDRLQDIEFCDVFKEGIELIQTDGSDKACGDRNLKAFNNFVNIWNSTAKDGYKWEDNPYVFVYEFERVTKED